jgi:hypothetical protein
MVIKINVKVKGIAPLLMNRFVMQDSSASKRGKKVYNPEEEAEKKTYRTEDKQLYLPSIHFKTSMVKAATDFKMSGKKSYKDYVKAGVFVSPDEIILDQQKYTIHEEPVVISRARVMSWRPKFKEWSCQFKIEITDEFIDPTTLKEILQMAGRYKGVGDHRPEFGRFEIVDWKVEK